MGYDNSASDANCTIPPSPVFERHLEVDGIGWRFLHCEGRDPAGVPALLIHGILGYSYSWRFNLDCLASLGPVYAPDLPGCGFSARPAVMDRSFSGMAGHLLCFLDALGLDRVNLIATSHGGAVAMKLAAAAPSRVRALVLAAPVNPWSEAGRWQMRLTRGPAAWVLHRFLPRLLPLNRIFLRRLYGDPRVIAPGTREAYSAPLRIAGTAEHFLEILRTWDVDVRLLARDLQSGAELSRIPALLIWGTRDTVVAPRSAEPLLRVFSQARLVWFEGVGHMPYEEAPERFNRAVSEFLAAPGQPPDFHLGAM